MELGIIGLPNVGKSILFNALTIGHALVSDYPFCTINPNVGIVEVPDKRLEKLFQIYKSGKLTPTTIKFIDIAGLVKGASKGEGLGNQFLSHIRNVDGIIHVVRCFIDDEIAHVTGDINPQHDAEIVDTELMLADLETVNKIFAKLEKKAKTSEKENQENIDKLVIIREALEKGKTIRTLGVDFIHPALACKSGVHEMNNFLTSKPVLFVANTGDVNEYTPPEINKHKQYLLQLEEYADKQNAGMITVSSKLEAEIVKLPAEEREQFRRELGMESSGLERLILASYKLLDLVTFFTVVGNKEVRAWTVTKGTKAIDAAGKIHSDMKRGFIRAEVFRWEDLSKAEWTIESLHQKGYIRTEGKDYEIKDGDVVEFRFNI